MKVQFVTNCFLQSLTMSNDDIGVDGVPSRVKSYIFPGFVDLAKRTVYDFVGIDASINM